MRIYSASTPRGASAGCRAFEGHDMTRRSTRAPRRRGGRARRTGSIPLKPRVVFCVEGASEEAYLRAILNYRYDDAFAFVFWRARGSKSSLRSLIEHVRRRLRDGEDPGDGVWIVCDTDQNSIHSALLEKWLDDDEELHHAALTDPCLEFWLILHYAQAPVSAGARQAEKELRGHMPGYRKGRPLPADLISRVDDAVRRERRRTGGADRAGAWPRERSSQMPALIIGLDRRRASSRLVR